MKILKFYEITRDNLDIFKLWNQNLYLFKKENEFLTTANFEFQ